MNRISNLLILGLTISVVSGFTIGDSNLLNFTKAARKVTNLKMGILDFLGLPEKKFAEPCVMGDESIMSPKAHGTSNTPVQSDLRWDCDNKKADNICNFNRHYAEYSGYWKTTSFIPEATKEYEEKGKIEFFDSNTGKLLFVAPKGRSFENFIKESNVHGWPSFRDEETVWDDVRCLPNGEAVSVDGTHLGHNLPDKNGNRYCINLVCVAGRPLGAEKK